MPKLFKSLKDIQYKKSANGSEKIGAGAFSKVKLISHKDHPGVYFAIKEINKTNKKEYDLIQKEIKVHSALNHPNIINFVDYIDTSNKVFIILEYAKNGDMFSYI